MRRSKSAWFGRQRKTGLDVEITGLLGIYTDPKHVIEYSDGEVRQEFAIIYKGWTMGGNYV